ncbi:MAG: anaerobic ribonucleoside-triphosphate reductase activating protein [Proteobacteria bacterium]|nr:anaerobic ribonucleoside-triphosphate reductase activating protein [Pseudomonadota bacterium]
MLQQHKMGGFLEVSHCDWPGRSSAVIFLEGCNMDCPTCHNRPLLTRNPEIVLGAAAHDYLAEFSGWIDGVVITGGEPTIYPHILDLVQDVKELGYSVNLNTNGHRPEVVRDLLRKGLVEIFSVDVKGPFAKYPALTGEKFSANESAKAMAEIFAMAAESPDRFYFRTTVVPGLSERDVAECRAYLPFGCELHLQDYREPVKTAA